MISVRALRSLLKDTIQEWMDDRAPQLAAALAFYSIFSFAPVLIIVIAVASMAFGREAVREELLSRFREFLGPQGVRAVRAVIEQARERSYLATAIGAATLAFGATAVFAELQEALNTVWGVKVKPGRSTKAFLRKRVLSFLMVIALGLMLLASLLLSTAISAAAEFVEGTLFLPPVVQQTVQFVVSFVVVMVLFACVYKVLPDVRMAWTDVWVGAAATALLFTIGKSLIGFYLATTSVGSAYGAAGSLVLLLVWVYYSAQVFLFGAEFTEVYARHRGRPIEPDQNALRVGKLASRAPAE